MRMGLAIGLDRYPHLGDLSGCIADALEMHRLLLNNSNGDPNYSCAILTSNTRPALDLRTLKAKLRDHLEREKVTSAVVYFAGHGSHDGTAAALMTGECQPGDPGLPMADLVGMANRSPAREVIIILDCCYSGAILNELTREGAVAVREGVSILAACRPRQAAKESGGRGVFTTRVCEALEGGAADVRGFVTVPSIYAYVCEVLSNWSSRPLLLASLGEISPLRRAGWAISDEKLRRMIDFFPTPYSELRLGPEYEPTAEPHDLVKEEIFSVLQLYRAARLLVPIDTDHMYYAAMQKKSCKLTPLGRFYWSAIYAHKI